ncbi:DUF2147 domain-containing protein [Salibacteraceae bacterium]|nr:DUF2147 domain-containing protein [Salibacteraceae bacterium]
MIKNSIFFVIALLLSSACFALDANDVIGKWKTVDDETGEVKSIIELYEIDNVLYGKVLKILNPAEVDNVCSKCEDNRKDQKILGMVILKDMVWDDDQWDDGTILDPKNGSVYDCKIWLEGDDKNKLYVRGYIGFFFRTQNWYRITE